MRPIIILLMLCLIGCEKSLPNLALKDGNESYDYIGVVPLSSITDRDDIDLSKYYIPIFQKEDLCEQ